MSSGKVIRSLQTSPLFVTLTQAELMALSNCGRIHDYKPNQVILQPVGQDERLFVLREGRIRLRLRMDSTGEKCGGEATLDLASVGDAFGWATWARRDRIEVSAIALTLTPVSLVALDLDRLTDSQTFRKVTERMLQNLYGRLQEVGLCPPNIQGLLRMGHLFHV